MVCADMLLSNHMDAPSGLYRTLTWCIKITTTTKLETTNVLFCCCCKQDCNYVDKLYDSLPFEPINALSV